MKRAVWTYELSPEGAASEGIEDYEVRSAEQEHVGIALGAVRRDGEMYLLVDRGAMPPVIHRRVAVSWEDVAAVDHALLVVWLSLDHAGLEEAALALDPRKAVHGLGAEAARVTRLPAAVTPLTRAGERRVVEPGYALTVLALAVAAPFSLFVIVALWATTGLAGWEYGLLGIPFVLAALTVALEGYRLYRAPHIRRGPRPHPPMAPVPGSPVHSAIRRRLAGKTELVLFAVGGGAVYLITLLAITLALGEGLPLLGWIGFVVASTIVLTASIGLAVFLVRSSAGVGSRAPLPGARKAPELRRVLVVADEGCSGEALRRPLLERLAGARAEVLVVAPALVSAVHYLDSDVDAARAAAQARLADIVAALEAAGIGARGEVGSESPLEAIADALAVFPADEIVVATQPPERTNWLEQGVVERARELYDQPVFHVLVGQRERVP